MSPRAHDRGGRAAGRRLDNAAVRAGDQTRDCRGVAVRGGQVDDARVRQRDGERGAIQAYGDTTYEATVTCTWAKDGATLTIPLPNSGVVDLSAANGYTATVTGLIAGANCGVVESATGGATTSVVQR